MIHNSNYLLKQSEKSRDINSKLISNSFFNLAWLTNLKIFNSHEDRKSSSKICNKKKKDNKKVVVGNQSWILTDKLELLQFSQKPNRFLHFEYLNRSYYYNNTRTLLFIFSVSKQANRARK